MHGEYKMPGGKLVVVDLEIHVGHLRQVQVSGDFFLEPDTALNVINAALDGMPASSGEQALALTIQQALSADVLMYGISPEAIAVAVRRALHTEDAA